MAENQKVKTSRDTLFERAAARFPDRRYKGNPANDANDANDGTDELEDSILEMLDEDSARLNEYKEKDAKLLKLLYSDPDATEVIQRWAETGDPRTALIEVFGDDFVEASKSEEGMAKFKDDLASWRERSAREKEIRDKINQNWEDSKAACVQWGEAKGLTIEQMRDTFVRLLAVAFNGQENKYGFEDFDMAWNAINHDSDVARARNEGEVAGRNAKIAARRHERAVAANMPPSSPGGMGPEFNERKPEPEEEKSIWADIH